MHPNQIYLPQKPVIPGRGQGIASMVLGIIGLVFSMDFLLIAIDLQGNSHPDDVFVVMLFSTFSILAIVLALGARRQGYINGVSVSGIVMGSISALFYFITWIMVLSA
ncbi:MAG: hypothetical protein E7575_06030 [Ruminococcaceae bacterium]|nr:hypothetical protein [Oscillospiraceae bacterium]